MNLKCFGKKMKVLHHRQSFSPAMHGWGISPNNKKISKQEKENPVDTRTKNVRTKDVHKRTFIFGSIWKHGKTFQSERFKDVFFTSLIFFLPHLIENKNYKDKY